MIPGATQPELHLSLHCNPRGERSYRCIRCKMVSKTVPENAYHIECGNCNIKFAYKDVRRNFLPCSCFELPPLPHFLSCADHFRWRPTTSGLQ